MLPRVLVLHATGSNRDLDACQAIELAGGAPEVVHINLLRSGQKKWQDYQCLVIPGGFSYADALGAGKLLAIDLKAYFADEVKRFVESGKPVIGICNGFQALVKAEILPAIEGEDAPQATLTFNESGHFECRWVTLLPASQKCYWTRGLKEPIACPVAHGEGNFIAAGGLELKLQLADQIALQYASEGKELAGGEYPLNPNGSMLDIAGVCNPAGNVLGLMPHPENHVFHYQHPRWRRNERFGPGLPLFINGMEYAKQI